MLQSLDVLIGLVVVLLALSMAVTVITQALTTLMNTRGSHLLQGVADLLQQLDETLGPKHSKAIARALLRHPLVSGSTIPLTAVRRLGNVVHREEFTKLLMALGSGTDRSDLPADVAAPLREMLARNGISNPEGTLARIRLVALDLEQKSPTLSHSVRQTLAVIEGAPTDLVAKINGWFDQTMDRTSQRFTASTRMLTFVGAFLVAFGLQMDTPALVNRLAAEPALRAALVQQASSLPRPGPSASASTASSETGPDDAPAAPASKTADTTTGASADAAAGTPGLEKPPEASNDTAPRAAEATVPAAVNAAKDVPRSSEAATRAWAREALGVAGVVSLPSSYDEWRTGFTMPRNLGMLITALLLSLGAPFWYGVLGQLLQLRSVLATKEHAQRQQRQSRDAATA